jgi:hypothetical protein
MSIETINRDPSRFHDKEINVAGRVVNSFGGAFELDDGTGRLWVLSDRDAIPSHNASVTVTGRIEQDLGLGGRTFVSILRETRKHN